MSISNLRPINPQAFDHRTSEFNASGVRRIIQEMFPMRKLVLSQFTLYYHMGVATPSGENYKRGRRCYRLYDLLPIALVLILKEQGIPNKNIGHMPKVISEKAEEIFEVGRGVRISGFKEVCHLAFPEEKGRDRALLSMLEDDISSGVQDLYWSYDVGYLASELVRLATRIHLEDSELDKTNKVGFRFSKLAVA